MAPATDGHTASVDAGGATDARTAVNVLIEIAANTRANAYAPYSGYNVGAALLTASGTVYSGCNVENAAIGLTVCAERAAVVKAISAGERDFDAIAVVTADGGTPCGACRQFLSEFGANITVIMADQHGHYSMSTVGKLLPHAFKLG